MKAELIGHGLNSKLKTIDYYLKKSFKNSNYDIFIGFSAYTKKNGLNLFSKELLEAKERFKSIKLYLGIAEGGTSKEALSFLIENKIETWTFCSFSDYIFHPKIYFFGGEFERRIIIGSSNLTKKGLGQNGNIEASVLIDYAISDTSGLKLQRQYFEYFEEIFSATNKCVKLLTIELLEDFVSNGYVVDEYKTQENGDSSQHKRNSSVKPNRKKIIELEVDEKSKQTKSEKESNKAKLKITDRYLETWDSMFNLFLDFKRDTGNVTIPRNHPSKALYRWYRLQKIFYADKSIDAEYELKYIHISRLEKAEFYFGDAHKLLQQNIEDEWLDILSDALSDKDGKEKIQVNHRYKYKGQQRLGTWLVGVSQANKKGKKIELREKIEDLGFDFTETSREPIYVAERFIRDLLSAENPKSMTWRTRFNKSMLNIKDKLEPEQVERINEAWFNRFSRELVWGKIQEVFIAKTNEWKTYRYDQIMNPLGKWYQPESKMGKLFWWVYANLKKKSHLDRIKHNFNEQELNEMRTEGFPV